MQVQPLLSFTISTSELCHSASLLASSAHAKLACVAAKDGVNICRGGAPSHLPRWPFWSSVSCHRAQRPVRRNHSGPGWPPRTSRARLGNPVPTGTGTFSPAPCFRLTEAGSRWRYALSKSPQAQQKKLSAGEVCYKRLQTGVIILSLEANILFLLLGWRGRHHL